MSSISNNGADGRGISLRPPLRCVSLRIIFWIGRWWRQKLVRDPRFRDVECAESTAVIGVVVGVRISIKVGREPDVLVVLWPGTGPPADNPFQALSPVTLILFPNVSARAATATTRLGFDQLVVPEVRDQVFDLLPRASSRGPCCRGVPRVETGNMFRRRHDCALTY